MRLDKFLKLAACEAHRGTGNGHSSREINGQCKPLPRSG